MPYLSPLLPPILFFSSLLPLLSLILSFRFLLPFSSSVFSFRFLLPFVLSFRSLLFILLSSIPLFHLPYRLSFCLPSCLPFQSVSYKSDKHTENKNPTTICLLQTEGYSTVCKVTPRFKVLKNTPLNRSADYRLRGADTLFRHLPPVSVFRTSAYHSENKSHTGFPLLQTAGGGHQSVKSHLASKY